MVARFHFSSAKLVIAFTISALKNDASVGDLDDEQITKRDPDFDHSEPARFVL